MRLALCLVLFLIVAGGCDSSDAPDTTTLRAPGGRTPVAGAIEFRDENNVLLGTFGSGSTGRGYLGTLTPDNCTNDSPPGGAVPSQFRLSWAYPNPTRGRTTMSLSVGCATDLSVFVVAALPPGSTASPAGTLAGGGWSIRPGGFPVAVLHEGPVTAGHRQVELDFRNPEGQPFPPGYYRVYAQTPYVIAWTDVLYAPDFRP